MKWLHGLLRDDSSFPPDQESASLAEQTDVPSPAPEPPRISAVEADAASAFQAAVDAVNNTPGDQISEQSTVIHSTTGEQPALRIVLDELGAAQARLSEQ